MKDFGNSNAWETTTEDIDNVLSENGVTDLSDEEINDIHGQLDHFAIEKAALYGVEMEDQIVYAYQEIEKQLRDLEIIE